MSYRRVSQIALVVLTGALVACGADQSNPTAPDLGGLASLTSEAPGNGGGGGRGGGGGGGGGDDVEQTLYDFFSLSGGYTTQSPLPVDSQELKNGILKVSGLGFNAGPIGTNFDYDPDSCQVKIGNRAANSEDAATWKERLLGYLDSGVLPLSWGMTVNINNPLQDGATGTGYFEGQEPFLTNTGILSHKDFTDVTVTLDNTSSTTHDFYTFQGGRVGVFDRNNKKRVVILCQHLGDITVELKLQTPRTE